MIVQLKKLIWEATPNTPPNLIPEHAKEVEGKGGKYLIYNDEYLNVQRAMANKKYVEMYVEKAINQFSDYETAVDEVHRFRSKIEMLSSAKSAGEYYRLYVRDLNGISEIPNFFINNPVLQDAWGKGYYQMEALLYEEAN